MDEKVVAIDSNEISYRDHFQIESSCISGAPLYYSTPKIDTLHFFLLLLRVGGTFVENVLTNVGRGAV